MLILYQRSVKNSYYEKIGEKVICIDDELPFEIPASWSWTRFGNIVFNYDSQRRPITKHNRVNDLGLYDYYGATGAIDKDTISEKYDALDDDEKKYIVLNLMNNPDFQKKCCEILCRDMKRCINDDATLKALDQLFGVSKYFDRLISAGIGCDHEYRIE